MLIPFQRLPALFLVLWQAEVGPEQFQSGSSVLWMFVQTILALGFVCLLAMWCSRCAARDKCRSRGKTMVNVIDRTRSISDGVVCNEEPGAGC